MVKLFRLALVALLAVLLDTGCAAQPPDLMGAYQLDDGRLVSIRRSVGKTFRARLYESGASFRLHRQTRLRYVAGPGFSDRKPVVNVVDFITDGTGAISGLQWTEAGATPIPGRRVNRGTPFSFAHEGVTLRGRLNLPSGPGPHPAVVLVHGSGSAAATEYFYNGDFLAAHGVATLTFDKRGTGRSNGRYTFDFELLAGDVSAAVEALAAHSDIDGQRIGLSGYSQGVWVAPLAASLNSQVSFILAHCGLVGSPAEEARVETRNTLLRRGVAEASLEEVDELTRAAVAVIASDFRDGWTELAQIKSKYKHARWRKHLRGTVIGKFVNYPKWLIKLIGRRQAPRGLPWYYDSTDVLQELTIPIVWLLAEADQSAPIELTLPAVQRLLETGKPYDVLLFPDTDHGMLRFTEEGAKRVYTGYAADYFRSEIEAAKRLAAPRR